MPKKQQGLLIRRSECIELLGVSGTDWDKMVREDVIKPVKLRLTGRAYYRRAEVLALVQTERKS